MARIFGLFRATIDLLRNLIDALKLEYLRAQYESQANQAIVGLDLINLIVMDLLNGELDHRNIILNSKVDTLMRINSLDKNAYVCDIRNSMVY